MNRAEVQEQVEALERFRMSKSEICGQMIEVIKKDARVKDFAKTYRKELRRDGEYVPRKMDDLLEEMFRSEDFDWMKHESKVLSRETIEAVESLQEEYQS